MISLSSIYEGVKNPIENEEVMSKLLTAYAESARRTRIDQGLYSQLVHMGENQDNSEINIEDKERFYIKTYNRWISAILDMEISQEMAQKQEEFGRIKKFQQYLKSFGLIEKAQDVKRLTASSWFEHELLWEQKGIESVKWDYIKSSSIHVAKEKAMHVSHRLYIGCQNQDIWNFIEGFVEKCESLNIPYYLKTATGKTKRDEKVVIYTDTEHLAHYIQILSEIQKEAPQLIARCATSPILTGKVSKWIGIGDEPSEKYRGEHSYNSMRAMIIEDGIEQALLQRLLFYQDKEIRYQGKLVNFNIVFASQVTKWISTMLGGLSDSKKVQLEGQLQERLRNRCRKAMASERHERCKKYG